MKTPFQLQQKNRWAASPSINRQGFTLIEMLVVIAIIAIISSLLIAGVTKAQRSAQRIVCASNLRRVGEAILLYAGDHRGELPGYKIGLYGQVGADYNVNQKDLRTLLTYLLPYFNITHGSGQAPVMICRASQKELSSSHAFYLTNSEVKLVDGRYTRPFGRSYGAPGIKLDMLANPSAAVSIFDLDADIWRTLGNASPQNTPKKPVHGNVRNFLFFDGHVEGLPLQFDPRASYR